VAKERTNSTLEKVKETTTPAWNKTKEEANKAWEGAQPGTVPNQKKGT
jgi:hypothetical protein